MNLCDPSRNRPVPSTGGNVIRRPPDFGFHDDPIPFTPVKCDRCGNTHNLHGDCLTPDPLKTRNATPPETGKIPHFNALEIQHLPQKIDGETEHLFLAFLNGRAVGSVKVFIWHDKSCDIQGMFVTPNERGKGIATRLLKAIETLAKGEHATHLELSCNRGNVNARQFWIRRGFTDDPTKDAQPDPMRYVCMVKPI